ncbi:G-type lectin S-receptor-like serine/threonine-protein kinase B120 [Diospyros lotus]|uniref:G-type lectin S-receptor-like serine/threonine-protein kinase B120 n=1 Tax=Diospyros lotus TaxID=55363 RepID=UPI00225B5C96|nr:G-type lectin S-receptor-like serine/threonine-protein kinase B120 [Diospyros lotus]
MDFSSKTRIITFIWFFFCSFSSICWAANNITQGQSISGGETIISAGQIFELGFFSPANSSDRYLGIWYYEIPGPSVVWVANRDHPVSGGNAAFTLDKKGSLVVLDGNGTSIWSSNSSSASNNFVAVLMDTGNLILSSRESVGGAHGAIWQSFDDPTDTFLPDMRVFMKTQGEEKRVFTSWSSSDDPSPGRYSMGVDPRGSPQIVIWDGQNRRWRSGYWNGLIFTGIPTMMSIYLYGFKLYDGENGTLYFTYTPSNSSDLLRFRIRWDGYEEQLQWNGATDQWKALQLQPNDECGFYNKCGAFGICSVEDDSSAKCDCIQGFEPKYSEQWESGNWSGGCVRKTELQCGNSSASGLEEDGFRKIEGVKLPDFASSMEATDQNDCGEKCLKNCSCLAYAFVDGISCIVWSDDLKDIEHFDDGGDDLYVRLAKSELDDNSKISKLVIIIITVIGIFLISVSIWLLWRFRTKLKVKAFSHTWCKKHQSKLPFPRSKELSTDCSGSCELGVEGQQGRGPELSLVSFSVVAAATNNFSDQNMLGKGGFGPVYKGKLPGEEEIAVKRLSRKSGQGLEEFKNEITLIAKLQHINLVRLLGCCIEGEERMLIYEYMPNKSLDSFLFDPTKREQLDWSKRFKIIEGIARGLIYLHRDSRFKIIHRDLKASNILLDEEMNPKISDFGMAKIFGKNEIEASTSRVVGTYGYMAPEYAREGVFSMKSDVYSFGVLLLEIISGKRNSSFRSPEHSNIVDYTWDLWDDGRAMELIDPSIVRSCRESEVLRCIHIALLCVQDSGFDRPNMSNVLLMLESETATLPMPRAPTFTSVRSSGEIDAWQGNHTLPVASSNEITVSLIIGR